ncbi:hypothetical protein [Streptomyces sp. NBC_01789]|uniref:hypothetical protein n=1 Tax=Streptomyces sp. NBC_01789 TaxID=2975941 RepID=UPI002259367D|nr:hypothetical protein [Streptomyces sp. NBC_01789]MCX4451553.1 hypothetical protein [Streptomyces sp. NBC_01789]
MRSIDGSVFGRGDEPDLVAVTRQVAETPGLQPEDVGVLVYLLLKPLGSLATGKDIAGGMRELGWKMSVDRFDAIAKRLIKAGHLMRKSVYNSDTKRPEWRYWAFHDPGKNPHHAGATSTESSQVSARIGFFPVPAEQCGRETGENPVSPGQGRNRAFPDFGAEPGKTRFPSDGVSAGQGRNGEIPGSAVAPPTPPYREEEDSSSRKSSSVTAVPAGASATDAADVTTAEEFLAELPGRWACGRRTAAEFAPLLADAVQAQGWELGSDLVQHLTRRAPARRSITSVLRDRIEDLPRYRAARRALEQDRTRSAAGQVPGQQLALEDQGAAPLPEGVSPERVEEARAFLLTLTGPWEMGPQAAERLAPLLASVSAERGWAFDERLRQQLMANPGGGQNYEWLLENRRIATLPDRMRKAPASRPAAKAGMCSRHPYFRADDCNSCVVIKRKQERAAAAAASNAAEADPAPQPDAAEEQVPADVAAYIQELVAGAAADEAARRSEPVLTDWEHQRLAEEAEHARRLEAHDAALNA